MGSSLPESEYRKLTKRWYRSKQWQQLRSNQLREHPWCQCPHHKGVDKTAPATVVDHDDPHRGDRHKFLDRNNLRSLTKHCHDKFKRSQELGGPGFLMGCDEQGNPISEEHEWWR
jgi:5-methylcytosine-specific restriction enzyme A